MTVPNKEAVLKKYKETLNFCNNNFIFIRINKTGSTTIKNLIKAKYNIPKKYDYFPHLKASFIQKSIPDIFESSKVVTSVINTWDRLASIYFFYKNSKWSPKEETFEEFIMKDSKDRKDYWYNNWEGELAGNMYYQDSWILSDDGKLIVDEVINMSKDDDIDILKKLGIKESWKVGYTNETREKNKRTNYTKEMIEKVKYEFKKEIEMFNFKYEDSKYYKFKMDIKS